MQGRDFLVYAAPAFGFAPLRNTGASSALFPPTFGSLRLLVQSAFQGLAQCMLARTIVSIVLSVP